METSEWISDPSGSTWSEKERVETRICAKCGCANLFNLVGRPIF